MLTSPRFPSNEEDSHHHCKFKRDMSVKPIKKQHATCNQHTGQVTTPPPSDPATSPSTPCKQPGAAASTTTPPRSALRPASSSTSTSSGRSVTFHPSTKTTVGRVGTRLPRRRSTISSIAEDLIDKITPHSAEGHGGGGEPSRVVQGHRVEPAVDKVKNESKWHRYAGKVMHVLSFPAQRACLKDMARKRKEEKRKKEQRKREKQRSESLQKLAMSGWNVGGCSVQPTYCGEKC